MARLTSFINPGADAAGAGFQGQQASIALGSGGIFGVGIGESVQKAFYLPEAHTDMIAAVIGEELGLIGISLLVGLYMLLGYAGFPDRPEGQGSLRSPARRRADGDDSGPGIDQPLRRPRPRPADRRDTPIRLLRKQQPDRHPRGRRPAAQRRQRRARAEDGVAGGVRAAAACGSSTAAGAERTTPTRRQQEVPVPRVVIAAGGTAGHVVPALAVADALAERGRRGQLRRHPRAGRGRARPRGRLRDRLPRRPRHRPPQPAQGGGGARPGRRRRRRRAPRCCATAAPTP